MDLKGKTAVVTGGAHRLGKEFVLALADEGVNIIFTYRSARLQVYYDTLIEVRSKGVEAIALHCDVSDYQSVASTMWVVKQEFEHIDILVNNASYFAKDKDVPRWQAVTRTAIDGTYYVTMEVKPLMSSGGVIINLLDNSFKRPWRDFTAHGVGKAAVAAMTRQWASDWAPAIRVNGLCLGKVLPPDNMPKEIIDEMVEHLPLGVWGKPKDATDSLKFLIQSDYITGEILTVDGGERWQ